MSIRQTGTRQYHMEAINKTQNVKILQDPASWTVEFPKFREEDKSQMKADLRNA